MPKLVRKTPLSGVNVSVINPLEGFGIHKINITLVFDHAALISVFLVPQSRSPDRFAFSAHGLTGTLELGPAVYSCEKHFSTSIRCTKFPSILNASRTGGLCHLPDTVEDQMIWTTNRPVYFTQAKRNAGIHSCCRSVDTNTAERHRPSYQN